MGSRYITSIRLFSLNLIATNNAGWHDILSILDSIEKISYKIVGASGVWTSPEGLKLWKEIHDDLYGRYSIESKSYGKIRQFLNSLSPTKVISDTNLILMVSELAVSSKLSNSTKEKLFTLISWMDTVVNDNEMENIHYGLLRSRCKSAQNHYGRDCGFFSYFPCHFRLSIHKGIVMGKCDLLAFTGTTHLYWDSLLRALISKIPGVGDLIGVPCIQYYLGKYKTTTIFEDMVRWHQIKSPYLVYTFIMPKRVDGKITMTRVNKIINKIWKTIKANPDIDAPQTFLTFTSWRIMVQWGFNNLSSYYEIITRLRDELSSEIYDTSSIVCWNIYSDAERLAKEKGIIKLKDQKYPHIRLGELWSENAKFRHDFKNHINGMLEPISSKQKMFYNILIETDGENDNNKLNQIMGALKHPYSPKAGMRGVEEMGFWDGSISVLSTNPRMIIYDTTNKIRTMPGIRRVVTIPQWFGDLVKKGTVPKSIKTGLAFDTPGNVCEITEKCWGNLGFDLHKNPYYRQIYDLKFQLEWLLYRAKQVSHIWKINEAEFLSPTPFFDLFIEEIYHDINSLNTIFSKSAKQMEINKDMWDKLYLLRMSARRYYKNLDAVIGTYNEQLEGLQLGTISDPIIRVGERAGLLDLISVGLNNLMKDYCGVLLSKYGHIMRNREILQFQYNTENELQNPQTIKEIINGYGYSIDGDLTKVIQIKNKLIYQDNTYSYKITYDKNKASVYKYCCPYKFSRSWSGIVSTSFSGVGDPTQITVDSFHQLLMVPIHTKLDMFDTFPLVAHEAMHFIIDQTDAGHEDSSDPINIINDLRVRLQELILITLNKYDKKKQYKRIVFAIRNKLTELADEIIADIGAGLIGGPLYYVSLNKSVCHPGYYVLVPSNDRLLIGKLLSKQMKWYRNWELIIESEYRRTSRIIKSEFKCDIISEIIKKFYKNCSPGIMIAKFLSICFEKSPLFFQQDTDGTQMISSKTTFKTSEKLSKNIKETSSLINENLPRYISAMAAFDESCLNAKIYKKGSNLLVRPHHPSTLIIQSLIYSK